VTESQARVWVRTDSPASVQVRYGLVPHLSDAFKSLTFFTRPAQDVAGQIPLSSLAPVTTYYYDILVDGVGQIKSPYPHFKTFPPKGQPASFKLLILTD